MNSFEKLSIVNKESQQHEKKKSPEKIMNMLKNAIEKTSSEFNVLGKEHLQEIPESKGVVLATSHISDYDMPYTYYALGNDLKIKFTRLTELEKFSVDPLTAGAIKFGGEENFLPVTYKGTKDSAGVFNPNDFEAMEQSIKEGDAVLLVAHRPSHSGYLDEHAGYADVYLAQLTDSAVVPIAVNSEANAMTLGSKVKSLFIKKPSTTTVGEPIVFPKIPGVEKFGKLIKKRKTEKLSTEEIAEFSRIRKILKEQSEQVMLKIAEMLPEEKRGIWNERLKQKQAV